jgi:SAM-dependent methyltransferase
MADQEAVAELSRQDARRTATALFRREWQTYRKLVANNYLFHDEAYGCLRRVLEELETPFRFLDIACGDAAASVRALAEARVAHYDGIDLSDAALALARSNVSALRCTGELHRGDYVSVLRGWRRPVDVAWAGLALHHLSTAEKRSTMEDIRHVLTEGGRLLLYENALLEREDRAGWLARWDAQRPTWGALTAEEWNSVTVHVHEADFPETAATWLALGREAGYRRAAELLVSPTNLFRLFLYEA